MEFYIHEVPGRLRLKIPGLKKNSQIACDIDQSLKNLPGIFSSSANTVTGSLTLHYDTQLIRLDAIVSILMREGHLDLAVFNTKRKNNLMETMAEAMSKAIVGFVLARVLQGTPFSFVTVFI